MARVVTADTVEPEDVQWLWRERIPRSMLTVLGGRPDQGKGMLAAHVAAQVSKEGGNVLYSAAEDSDGLMTRPRLEAAGAVLKRIHLWRFMLPTHLRELADIVVDKEIDLIVLDPLAAHLDRGVSRHSDNIREVLNPLTEIIEMTGTGVLVVEHVNKRVGATAHPLSAIGGSGSGLPAACRMGFLFGTDPDNEEQKVLACVKSNIRERPQALFFETDDTAIDGIERSVPFLVSDSEGPFDAIRLVSSKTQPGKVGRPADKRAQAAEWLTNYLAEKGEAVKATTIYEDAKQFGMTSRTLRRACADMGIVRNPAGGGPNCTWELPDEILELLKEADESIAEGDTTAALPGQERTVAVVPDPDGDGVIVVGDEDAVIHGSARDVLDWIEKVEVEQAAEMSNVELMGDDDEALISDDDLAAFLGGE